MAEIILPLCSVCSSRNDSSMAFSLGVSSAVLFPSTSSAAAASSASTALPTSGSDDRRPCSAGWRQSLHFPVAALQCKCTFRDDRVAHGADVCVQRHQCSAFGAGSCPMCTVDSLYVLSYAYAAVARMCSHHIPFPAVARTLLSFPAILSKLQKKLHPIWPPAGYCSWFLGL